MLDNLKKLKKEFEKAELTDCVKEIENKIKKLENNKKSKQERLIRWN
nr:hypothetical protein [Methanobrevibacter arboriphilus]